MLQAVLHHKLRGEIHAQCSGKARNAPEDLITSTVFGPLRYLSTNDVWSLCEWIFFHRRADNVAKGSFEPHEHEICFWPSLDLPTGRKWEERTRVEPDVAFVFKDANGPQRVYLVEVKWGARLSDGQLQAQHDASDNCGRWGSAVITQILLTKDGALDEDSSRQVKETRSAHVTWLAFRRGATSLREIPESAHAWATDVAHFLSELGIITFNGFNTRGGGIHPGDVTWWRLLRFQVRDLVSIQQLKDVKSWII